MGLIGNIILVLIINFKRKITINSKCNQILVMKNNSKLYWISKNKGFFKIWINKINNNNKNRKMCKKIKKIIIITINNSF